MLAELRAEAQVTIPEEIIIKLGLSEGDKLDIFEKGWLDLYHAGSRLSKAIPA